MKGFVSEGRGLVLLWGVLALLSVAGLAVPALAADIVPAPAVEVMRQEWGLPLTIVELGVLVAVIVPLVIGVTEFAKQFGVTGKWSRLFAMVLGLVIGGLVVAAALDVLPGWAGIAIVILLGGLLAGLAATGLYDLQNKRVKATERLALELRALAYPKSAKPATFGGLDEMITTNKPEPHPRIHPQPADSFGPLGGHGVQGG